MAFVEVERQGAVARVWLNRPEQHNALYAELGAELRRRSTIWRTTSGARRRARRSRALVLRRRRHRRDEGVRQRELRREPRGGETARRHVRGARATFPSRSSARIHGNVLGGGVGFTCACDIASPRDDAMFGLTEVRLGILPALISPYVIRRLGDRDARESCSPASASMRATAAAHRARAPRGAGRRARRQGRRARRRRCSRGATRGAARIKMLLELYADSTWEEYRAALPRTLAEVRSGDEAKEGLGAFFEKRKPKWTAVSTRPAASRRCSARS